MPKEKVKSTEALAAFCERYADDWEKFVPLKRLCDRYPGLGAAGPYRHVLSMIKAGHSLTDIKAEILKDMKYSGSDIHHRDILAFIETGEGYLPGSIYDIPAFVAEEQRKADEEFEKKMTRQRREREEQERQALVDEKKRRRATLATELGLKPDALEQLTTTGETK